MCIWTLLSRVFCVKIQLITIMLYRLFPFWELASHWQNMHRQFCQQQRHTIWVGILFAFLTSGIEQLMFRFWDSFLYSWHMKQLCSVHVKCHVVLLSSCSNKDIILPIRAFLFSLKKKKKKITLSFTYIWEKNDNCLLILIFIFYKGGEEN